MARVEVTTPLGLAMTSAPKRVEPAPEVPDAPPEYDLTKQIAGREGLLERARSWTRGIRLARLLESERREGLALFEPLVTAGFALDDAERAVSALLTPPPAEIGVSARSTWAV